MLRAAYIRRVRQTLMATNLAQGALVAWQVPEEKLDAAFDYMFQQDPFSAATSSSARPTPRRAGSQYRLWTTLKVPQGYSMKKHCELLTRQHRRGPLSASCPPRGCSRWASATCAAAAWSRAASATSRPDGHRTSSTLTLNDLEWRS